MALKKLLKAVFSIVLCVVEIADILLKEKNSKSLRWKH